MEPRQRALQLGDDDAQQHFYGLALSRAREAGAVTAVVYALQRLCFSHFLAGDLVAVRSSAEEALVPRLGIGPTGDDRPPLAWLTLLAALQGGDEYDDLLPDVEDAAAAHPLGILTDPVHDLTRWAKGIHAAPPGTVRRAAPPGRFRLPALSADGRGASASTPRFAPASSSWPALGRRAGRVRRRQPDGPGRWPPSPTGAR